MKELKSSIIISCCFQLISLIAFTLVDEVISNFGYYLFFLILFLLLGIVVSYFVFFKKYTENKNLNIKRLKVLLFFVWIVLSFIIFIFLTMTVGIYFHICNNTGGLSCFLNGIEYFIFIISLGLMPVIILLLEIIKKISICLYKYIKNKNTIVK